MSVNSNIDLETSITEFLERGRELLENTLTVERIFNEVTTRYRDQRINGAVIENSGDMVLIDWGESRLMRTPVPTDLRNLEDGGPEWYSDHISHFSMARQLHVETGDNDDFDGNAVAMHIDLGFSDAVLSSANQWVESPDDIATGRKILLSDSSMSAIWTMPSSRVAIFVGTVG